MENDSIVVGECPLCHANVLMKEKLFICEKSLSVKENDQWVQKGCKFRVFKNQLEKLGKPEIYVEEMRDLLEKKSILVDLISKKGFKYFAVLKIDKKESVRVQFRHKYKFV